MDAADSLPPMSNVSLSSGVPETVLDDEPESLVAALGSATDRSATAALVARHPRSLLAWVSLGDMGRDSVERYSAYRVAYHRGLDQLRASGWRGSGYVRWDHESNRGFLRALDGLRAMAEVIGEDDEAARCAQFLRQLDPHWPPPEVTT